ncbi:unnamed protein product [Rotaria sp. Silwood2]|nr:unnamed protein product [Rotaria sp. Silwood2]CAF2696994.1 unnamed protein product [Rotaria sp. Silwood2]CAF2936947.1 unnamed protein product [Rotaria sp. Silwood2]CAF3131326.1 unnamed protein product [Rotaria sp. Silwood2]CAF3920167.1 unnamed protein product [Rotaria sp. Silwood2]
MSSHIKKIVDIQLLATYGTLRDDDNSGAPWTKDFIKNINHATTGKIVGYQLLGHPIITYPFAIYTGDPNDSIVVRLLSWPSKEQFQEKINQADIIEGDEYERKVVEVLVENETKLAYIYISKSKLFDKNWKVIPSGDWLKRHLK